MRIRDFLLSAAIALALIAFAAVAHLLLVPILSNVGSMRGWVLTGWLLQPLVLCRVLMEETARAGAIALVATKAERRLAIAISAGLLVGVLERIPDIASATGASAAFGFLAILGILAPIVVHVVNSVAAVALASNIKSRPVFSGLLFVGMSAVHLFQNQFLVQVAGKLPWPPSVTALLAIAGYSAWGWFSLVTVRQSRPTADSAAET